MILPFFHTFTRFFPKQNQYTERVFYHFTIIIDNKEEEGNILLSNVKGYFFLLSFFWSGKIGKMVKYSDCIVNMPGKILGKLLLLGKNVFLVEEVA
jgi:hypothetical protein